MDANDAMYLVTMFTGGIEKYKDDWESINPIYVCQRNRKN